MSKHEFLAPWKTGPYDPRYVFDRNGQEVAYVHNHYELSVPQARLIAAAPDLLEALIAVKSILTSDNYVIHKANGDDVSIAEIGAFIELFERADAAIAKATGAD